MKTVRLILLLCVGLTGLCGCSAMKPGRLDVVAPQTPLQTGRVGTVYLLRGWIGIFSTGIDSLGQQVNDVGIHAEVFQADQWSALASTIREKYRAHANPEPLILVGHSYGADDVIRIARELNADAIRVDLLITLDPVTPPPVPGNVVRTYNLYQSNGMLDNLPWLRGIALEREPGATGRLDNFNIRTDRTELLEPGLDHFNIEKKQKIHDDVLTRLKEACPERGSWDARLRWGTAPSQASVSHADPGE